MARGTAFAGDPAGIAGRHPGPIPAFTPPPVPAAGRVITPEQMPPALQLQVPGRGNGTATSTIAQMVMQFVNSMTTMQAQNMEFQQNMMAMQNENMAMIMGCAKGYHPTPPTIERKQYAHMHPVC